MNRRDQILKKRGHSRRLLSVLLALVMLLSLLPTAVFAADPAPQTFKKVTSAEELVTGQYVLVDEKGFSPKELSGKWVTTAAVTVNGATATASEGIWTITVSADGVVLTDANSVSIAPSGGNNNGITSGSYKWSVAFANGAFTFSGQGSDTVKLAGNAGSSNQYKAYKNSTVSGNPNGYPSNFTLYKLDAASARQSGIVTDLTALQDGDTVVVFNPSVKKAMSATAVATFYRAGVDVTLDSANKLTGYGDTELWTLGIKDGKYTFTTADGKKLSMGASYSSIPLDDVNTEWAITSAATEGCFYIKNVVRGNALQWYADKGNFSSKASISTTDEALFAQQLYLVIDSGSETPDPEPTFVPISTALAGAANTEFTVKGVVTFTDGRNVFLQDDTGGICLYLASKADAIALGDTVIGTGKRSAFNGMPQLGSGTYVKSSGLTLTAKPTTLDAITESDLGTYVKLTDLEITKIDDNGGQWTSPTVTVKDAAGNTMPIYRAAMSKENGSWAFAVGDKVDVTAAVGTYNSLQLRTTVASEITAHSTIYDPISDDMIPAGAITVKEAGAITSSTSNVSVVGQVVYHYGNAYNNKASINSIILEDVIDGEIYGFQVYDYTNYAKYKVGDIVKITGTVAPYNGVPQMSFPSMEVIKTGVEAIPAQEITVSQMGKNYLSEYVYIKDVTLGAYNATGNTTVTDVTGSTNLFKGVPLASGVTVDDITAVYGCCSAYNSTYQLRNGSSADYVSSATPPTPGGLPTVGDQVVIYNQNAQAVLAAQNDNATSPAINKAAATIQDGKATCANGAVVFEVQKNGDYYRFYNKTYGYLCANGTGNNAFYTQTASDDADWLVRTCSGNVGGYEMESRTAKFNNQYSQWLEYYSDSFKVYSMYNVTDYTIYSFFFYPVAEGTTTVDGVVNNPAVVLGDLPYAYVGTDYSFTFTVDAPFGVQGDMTAKLNGTSLSVTKGEDGTYTVTIPAASVTGDQLTVNISGTDNKYIPISAAAEITVKDEPVFSDPTPARGSQTGEDKRPAISVALANAGQNPTVTMSVGGKAVAPTYESGRVTYTPTADMTDGRVDVKVTATRADSKSAEFSWFFTVGKTTYQPYFGQLHSHTQYSDGSGTLDSALSYIRSLPDSANVQFVAFTDHSNYFDSKNAPNVEAALYDTSLVKDSDASHSWKTYKDTIAQFNEDNAGDMVAIGGFEMTWSGGPGHINTFNTPGIVSRNNSTLNNKTDDAGMKAYYALLSQAEGKNSISQFNHPGTTFGNFKDFNYWDPVIDSRMYMVEVGNGEGQIGAGGYYPSYEQYIMALDKGWHLAPTNNQDNHKGKWGNANDARDVILTDSFTEEGIYDAIRALRMYATEDKNLELTYTVNGLMMGSSITEVPDKLNIEVTVNDPDASDSIAKVEVVANSGKVAYTWDNAAQLSSGKLSVTLDPSYSYYFIRVTQKDGDLAVTSPVWVGESLKLGISNMVCGTATPVTDEELTLTTTFFNSEGSDATIKSLTYSIGGTVIGTDKTGYTLAKSSTLDVPFKYTPTAARVFTVQVTAVVEQGGNEYTFTKTVDLDVLDADSLVYIGLDGSHHNEYINGNYSDTMGNFQTLANKYGVRLVELMTKDELMNACNNPKFKAIVLTAPSRREKATGNGIDCYADDELAAIKAYNEKGGIVLVMGYSDYYETAAGGCNVTLTPEQHMAAQQNLILAALGSKLRLGDDQTSDTAHNDGRNYGIYTASYGTSELLEGLVYSEEAPFDTKYSQVFSQYGGCSVYIVDENGTPVSAVPSTVTPVVYGNATTASGDGDSDGLGGATMPKYDGNILLLATEKIGNNGMILVTGGTMMADWQLQVKPEDIDSGADLLYSNYTIMENLLQIINPVKITPISEVHAQKEEGFKYTIEGIVTSNASGHDKDTAFFDCIYVQDETGGINCFPVAGDFKIGDRVRVSGTTSSYQGERQLAVTSITKLDEGTPVTPKAVTSTQVNDGSVLGQLVTLNGYVTGIEMANGKVQTILVRDPQGQVARVFIDGYICPDSEVQNLKVGCEIEATGLASYDNTFVLEDGTPMAPRIRTRDRADIVCTDHTHAFGDWEKTTPATCTADGVETRSCACGETETRAIPATGHVDADNDGKCDVCQTVLTPVNPGDPDNPTPDNPDKPTPDTPDKPATGDNSAMVLWVSVMSITALAGAALIRSKKRRA